LGALDGIGAVIWCLVLQVLSAEGGAEGRCGRSVGAAGEIATPGGSGVGGWRQGCDGHELDCLTHVTFTFFSRIFYAPVSVHLIFFRCKVGENVPDYENEGLIPTCRERSVMTACPHFSISVLHKRWTKLEDEHIAPRPGAVRRGQLQSAQQECRSGTAAQAMSAAHRMPRRAVAALLDMRHIAAPLGC